MKTGISMITMDRPVYLESTIISLGDISNCEKVLVDNGTTHQKETKAIANKYKFLYIDGHQNNQANSQNITYGILKETCDYILKTEDDLVYGPNHLSGLEKILDERQNVGACSGICWARMRTQYMEYQNGRFGLDDHSAFSPEQLACYRYKNPYLFCARHLHGAILARASVCKELEEKTKHVRGGIYNAHLSKVSGKEETEFSLLIRQICKKDLVVDTSLEVFHEYAPGGTRIHNVGKLIQGDIQVFLDSCKKLGADSTTAPSLIGIVE